MSQRSVQQLTKCSWWTGGAGSGGPSKSHWRNFCQATRPGSSQWLPGLPGCPWVVLVNL